MYKWSIVCITGLLFNTTGITQPKPEHNLIFPGLPTRWDEGLPMGNGHIGALIWEKDNHLRLSLDRVDLWDDRPMPEIERLKFNWVKEKVAANQYDSVQRMGDEPYEKYPAPSKIPGAGLEFSLASTGKAVASGLDISNGKATVQFSNSVVFHHYVHAGENTGYFKWEHVPASFQPKLTIPSYVSDKTGTSGNSVDGQSLERLGYQKGKLTYYPNGIRYHQPTWNGGYYEVLVTWKTEPNQTISGRWTISNNKPAVLPEETGSKNPWNSHESWWRQYWSKSAVQLPDSLLERQYYLEMYKFACVARSNTPPISLQAIWTADNGKLPPWKGDFHHDLNTQLSYWPGYTANHTDLTAGFTNWLWKVRNENKKWTRAYFGLPGLNVPGVTTISGKPMGGWIQYSFSPTTAAWLAQHFYWQWSYTKDRQFLTDRAIPYLQEVSNYFRALLQPPNAGSPLPLSSSPEYYNNSIRAWFTRITNYDLALLKHYEKIAHDINRLQTGKSIPVLKYALPPLDEDSGGLTIAPGQSMDESHRHHSPYMAIYPLQLLDKTDSADAALMEKSLRRLAEKGTREWVGYSFAWAACLYARAGKGDSAAAMLTRFASNFCAANSFHLNGDQRGGQYSAFTYRPFTLEGNFAFAQGIHEMLIQEQDGVLQVLPAIPSNWNNLNFKNLRTPGAFLVSASVENRVAQEVRIVSPAGGVLKIKLPFRTWLVQGAAASSISMKDQITTLVTKPGQVIVFKNAFE